MPPSSMLKLMTLTVLFDAIKSGNLKMDDLLTASENADYKNPLWYPASKLCLIKGQQITVRDAILGIIVLSAGDASVVVAEHFAGSETKFTDLMTKKAREIGMEQSTFGNASGLPHEANLMTSKEVLELSKKYENMYCVIGVHPEDNFDDVYDSVLPLYVYLYKVLIPQKNMATSVINTYYSSYI